MPTKVADAARRIHLTQCSRFGHPLSMPNLSIRIGGVGGWSIRATILPSRGQFGKSHFSHVELWRDADVEQGTEAKLHVSVALTDDAGCLDALTRARIIEKRFDGVSMD